jgi:hypothetical protein
MAQIKQLVLDKLYYPDPIAERMAMGMTESQEV